MISYRSCQSLVMCTYMRVTTPFPSPAFTTRTASSVDHMPIYNNRQEHKMRDQHEQPPFTRHRYLLPECELNSKKRYGKILHNGLRLDNLPMKPEPEGRYRFFLWPPSRPRSSPSPESGRAYHPPQPSQYETVE
ncbi:hypothetical protein J6590_073819 [Homalodisca vitripennis]|nr:hypothetical protein J6590_073819 [Homalodisca vitripennis]